MARRPSKSRHGLRGLETIEPLKDQSIAPVSGPQPRQAILEMHPYEWEPPSAKIARQAGVPEDQVLRFDTNTLPWPGASVDGLGLPPLNEYPDTSYGALISSLAAYTGAEPDAITVGAGADELLDLVAKAYIGPGDPVVLSRLTYAMFRIVSEMAGGSVEAVATDGLSLDRAGLLQRARQARLTWLCNPNNPTGELYPLGFIEELADATPGVVAVDEAYFEFSGVSAAGLADRYPNLLVVRTLSKAFGLAGVRVGYALAGQPITSALRRVRPPGSVSVVSEALAVQSLRDQTTMRNRVQQITAAREELRRDLVATGFEVPASAGNFLLVRTGDGIAPALLRSGLVVRSFGAGSPLAAFIRITVRTPAENRRLLEAMAGWRRTSRAGS
jgi:histidinol-phosphate aminotransferase